MEADIRWLDDPKVFRVGQLPAHSDHPIYQDTEEAAEGRSSLGRKLGVRLFGECEEPSGGFLPGKC